MVGATETLARNNIVNIIFSTASEIFMQIPYIMFFQKLTYNASTPS
jgi:hypothetical protein